MKHTLLKFLVVMLVVGCNSTDESSGLQELESLPLTEDITISADNADVLIGNFRGLISDDKGTIYAADTKLQKIHLFSTDGTYQESIGRKGKGPGEFDRLNPEIRIQADTLYVLQNKARKVDLFDLNTSRHIRTISIPDAEFDNVSLGTPQKFFPLQNGNILIVFSNPYFTPPEEGNKPHFITVSELNASGEFINKSVLQLPVPFPTDQRIVHLESQSINIFSAKFYPDFVITSDDEGTIYVGKSDSLQIQQYNGLGKQTREVKGISSPVSFTGADLDSLSADMAGEMGATFKKAVGEVGQPDYWPAFQNFLVDESGRCWVQLLDPGKEHQVWQVLDDNGDPAWKFELPSDVNLLEVKQGHAYGINNPEGGLPSIIRYNYTL